MIVWSALLRWARRWGPWVVLPTLLNAVLWWGWVGPQHRRLAQWRQARQMAAQRPALEALVAKSEAAVSQWRRGSVASDAQTIMQHLQRLADRHRVQLAGLDVRAASSTANAPIELEATGSFHQLANWIGELEALSGVQLESWTIAAASEPGQPHQAKLSLSAFGSS